jgi:hypothetical protein
MKKLLLPILCVFAGMLIAPSCKQDLNLTPAEAKEIAKEAYIYGFPMVVNYKTMYMYVLDEDSPEYKGPLNQVSCDARLFTPEDKAVVTPNSDTPYCMFWVDIRNEPVVISLPEMEEERFYHFQLIDLYTHNFAYLGSLTTGNGSGSYLIAPHSWKGKVPGGVDQVVRCETELFFVVVRTQLMDSGDLENVKGIQAAYRMESFSKFTGSKAPAQQKLPDFPRWKEGDQFTTAAFKYMDVMLGLLEPVGSEMILMRRFARLGIGTEQGFDLSAFEEPVRQAIEEGVKEGFEEMETFIATQTNDPLASAKIFGTRDFLMQSAKENYELEEFYTMRAVAAHMGLYGNSGAEAIYPTYLSDADGAPLNAAENSYTLTFFKEDLPPVKAFWSVTMYDGLTQLFIHNELDRYLLNSTMEENFVYGEDGSLTLYIQKDHPGPELEANWLPAPEGPFYAVMRLYGPEEEALNGEWINPPIQKNK